MYSITAIVPAYNEEKTIGDVLSEIKKVKIIDDIIVVSDGSTDRTVEIAKSYNVKVVDLSENLGKGGALKEGVDKCISEIILLLDADLIGLNTKHIEDLLLPVIEGEVDMTIGLFNKGRLSTDFAQKVTPYLSGQRAIRRYIIDNISDIEMTRYGVEAAVTKYVKENNINSKRIPLEKLTHMMKEEKFGVVKGFTERMRMYWEVIKTFKARR
ncbi:putative glycosyl transferase family 2 protein [Gottschalkia acidurici 9a]|uniref:Glucosyl-3-phosphoglycerate synthase n=1 Tax=Gottschalkia acidurici (strain ATCC 7906 / DSM 604 / BCRC 14475 / CIP 104303 / KCTC 5404 / NCIMB 10678 / 9a) TaxID=1128398 RepID=K0B0W7_GOTA9|nr:glycosyltransferase family 2 protein [Gottschalkia acidurici]AFS78570.1 putative glycosyl transferase family 2 protein [Gottschalkia acidurici 9a]